MTKIIASTCVSGNVPSKLAILAAAAVALNAHSAVAQSQDDSVFEEIIVTSEKREESLQTLSQSVTAMTGRTLDVQGVRTFIDLSALAPGLTVNTSEDFRPVISVRGLGNEGNQNNIVNPSVSFHIDGVYVASQFALKTDFLDVERVEVLRGPQGTLFGQNSIGGTINVTTQAPRTDEFEAAADIAYGSFDHVSTRGALNVPVSDTFALRASVVYTVQDGTATNISTNANNLNFDEFTDVAGFEEVAFLGNISPNGQKRGDLDNLSWRLRANWTPTTDFELALTAQQFSQDTNGAATFGLTDPTPLRDADGNRQFAQDSPASLRVDSDFYSAVASYSFPAFTLKAIGSYQQSDINQAQDNDRSDNAFVSSFVLANALQEDAYVAEVSLVSNEPLFDKLEWVVGAFYFKQDVNFSFFELLDLVGENGDPSTLPDGEFEPFDSSAPTFFLGFAPAGTDLGFQTESFVERESFSLYGQGTYAFTDAFSLTGGLRYSDDSVDSETYNFFTLPNGVAPAIATQGDTVFTGRLALEYLFSSGHLAYASYTRGSKPGGSNLTFGLDGDAAPAVVQPTFGKETVNAYEVGLKGDYAGGRLRANLAAFYYDYKNLQFQATDPNVFQGGVASIPESEIYGFEAEVQAALSDNFIIEANMAYLDTEITSDFLALDNVAANDATNALLAQGEFLFGPVIEAARAAQIANVRGNQLAKTPKFTSSVNVNYSFESNLGESLASFQWVHRGSFEQRIFNNPVVDDVGSYNQLNLFFSHEFTGSGFGVEFAVRNLTDTDGVNARFTDVFGVGATGDALIPPRQFLARLKYRFS